MVITPKQTLETLNKKDRLALRKLEAQIDANLMQGRTLINVVGGIDARIKQQLMTRYTHAGWEVNYQCDPAKGDYLFFNQHKEVMGFRQYGN
jgi:hypothetical protein